MRLPDPVRPHATPSASRHRRHAAGPRRGGAARLPRAGRGAFPGAADRPRGRPDGRRGVGRADRRRRGRGGPVPRRHARLPGHPAPARGRGRALRRGRRPGARRRRSSSRSTPRSAPPSRPARSGGSRMIGSSSSPSITIVLFIVILGALVLIHELGHFVTARWAKVRVLEFGIGFPPRAKVLGRGKRPSLRRGLAPPRPDPRCRPASSPARPRREAFIETAAELEQEPPGDHLHAQLAADRRLREARGRGRRRRAIRARSPRARLPVKVGILRRGRRDEPAAGVRDLHGHRAVGRAAVGVRIGKVVAGSPAAAGRPRRAATAIVTDERRSAIPRSSTAAQAIDDLAANDGQSRRARDPPRRRHHERRRRRAPDAERVRKSRERSGSGPRPCSTVGKIDDAFVEAVQAGVRSARRRRSA